MPRDQQITDAYAEVRLRAHEVREATERLDVAYAALWRLLAAANHTQREET